MTQDTLNFSADAETQEEKDRKLFEGAIVAEVVSHPHGGYTHAIPVPGTSCRVYEGWWRLKRKAEAAFFQRFPFLQPRPRLSKARSSSVPLPMGRMDDPLPSTS